MRELAGWLYKRGKKGVIKSWKKRWFLTRHDRVLYYPSVEESKGAGVGKGCLGCIVLPCITSVEAVSKPSSFPFNVVTKDRTYELLADSREERERWMQGLIALRDSYLSSPYADISFLRDELKGHSRSILITFHNTQSQTLKQKVTRVNGKWIKAPPDTVQPNSFCCFAARRTGKMQGVVVWLEYVIEGEDGVFCFKVCNPYLLEDPRYECSGPAPYGVKISKVQFVEFLKEAGRRAICLEIVFKISSGLASSSSSVTPSAAHSLSSSPMPPALHDTPDKQPTLPVRAQRGPHELGGAVAASLSQSEQASSWESNLPSLASSVQQGRAAAVPSAPFAKVVAVSAPAPQPLHPPPPSLLASQLAVPAVLTIADAIAESEGGEASSDAEGVFSSSLRSFASVSPPRSRRRSTRGQAAPVAHGPPVPHTPAGAPPPPAWDESLHSGGSTTYGSLTQASVTVTRGGRVCGDCRCF